MNVSFKSTPAHNSNVKYQNRKTAAAVAGTALGIATLATIGKAAGKSATSFKFVENLKDLAAPVTKKMKHAYTALKVGEKIQVVKDFVKKIYNNVAEKVKGWFNKSANSENGVVAKAKKLVHKVADKETGIPAKAKEIVHKAADKDNGVVAKAKGLFHKAADKDNGVVAKAKDLFHKAADKDNGVVAKAKGLFHKAADKETGIIPRAKELLANIRERFAVPEKFHPEHFQVDGKLGEEIANAAKTAAEKL